MRDWLQEQAQRAEEYLRSLPPELLSPVARDMLTKPSRARHLYLVKEDQDEYDLRGES